MQLHSIFSFQSVATDVRVHLGVASCVPKVAVAPANLYLDSSLNTKSFPSQNPGLHLLWNAEQPAWGAVVPPARV